MGHRQEKGKRAAIKAAYLSGLRSHRVGAALMHKNKLVSIGWNCKKTHPACKTEWSQHAEFNVFIGMERHLIDGCDIYVARVTRSNRVGMARPCKDCRQFLSYLNINKIYYTNKLGDLEELILAES